MSGTMRISAAALIMRALLVIGVLFGAGIACAYAATPTAAISSNENIRVEAGDTVTVPIIISDNPGIMGIGLTVEYDGDVLTPVSAKATSLTSEGNLDDSIETSKQDSFDIKWAHSENITSSGTLFNVTFRVSEYAQGDTTVKLGYVKRDTFNEDFNEVALECSPIVVNVKKKSVSTTTVRGDANLTACDGDTVLVPLLIENVSSVTSLSASLTFDTKVFAYEDSIAGLGSGCTVTPTESGCRIDVSSIDTSTASGTLVALKLKVAEYVGGNYVFTMASDDVSTENFRVKVTNSHATENASIAGGEASITGTELTVPVMITNNHGIAGFRIAMAYDKAVLSPVSITKNNSLSGSFNNTIDDAEGAFDVLWTGTENFNSNDVLYTVKFNVLDSSVRKTTVGMTYTPADTCDEEARDVALTMNDIEVVLNDTLAPELTSISATKEKIDYFIGDELLVNDLEVTATYSDGSTAVVEGWTSDAEGVDMSTDGFKTITVTYVENGVTATCEVVVIVDDPNAEEQGLIWISVNPVEKTFHVGDTLDLSDVKVTAVYDNREDAEVGLDKCTVDISDVDMQKVGEYSVEISYTENGVTKSEFLYINVVAREDGDDKGKTDNDKGKTDNDKGKTDNDKGSEADGSQGSNATSENGSTARDIGALAVSLDTTGCDKYMFGTPLKPRVNINGLVEGRDYQVSYVDNINAGIGKVVIAGTGSYKGTVVKNFKIDSVDIDEIFPVLLNDSEVYTGSAIRPSVYFPWSDNVSKNDYQVIYSNNVNIGEARAVVVGKGNLRGTQILTFDIVPAKAAFKKVKSKKAKRLTIQPKAQAGGVKYQVSYRLAKKGKWKTKVAKKKGVTIKKLKAGKKYKVRVRAFKKVNGITFYGEWSKTKTVKIKR